MNTAIRSLVLFMSLLFCGLSAVAAEPLPFKCEGSFARDTSDARMRAAFGAANVQVQFDDEYEEEVTVVFPNDPARRLKVRWKGQRGRREIARVIFAGSSWSVGGITFGMPMVEVERLNGRPFQLNDFQGDYSGAISDWLGGRFDTPLPGGCRVGAGLWIADGVTADGLDREVLPDGSRLSSRGALRRVKPIVNQISVGFTK